MPNNKKDQKGKNDIDVRALKRVLKLYVLPLISMALFLLIVIFLVLPKIGDIFTSLDQISADNNDYNQRKAKLDQLTTAAQNTNQMVAQLNEINNTTPTGKTEVVKFRDKITALTDKDNLVILSQQLSENSLSTTDQSSTTTPTKTPTTPAAPTPASDKLSLQEVPFTFEIQGSYDSIVNFIKDLSAIDDFIIVREMHLSSNAIAGGAATDSDVWVLKLTIDKYQFSQISTDAANNLYSNIPIDADPNKTVIDYINSRIK